MRIEVRENIRVEREGYVTWEDECARNLDLGEIMLYYVMNKLG